MTADNTRQTRRSGDAECPLEGVDVSVFTVPTDFPESDGTLSWDSTTIVVVEPRAEGITGLGYTYSHPAAARVVTAKLAPLLAGRDAMQPPEVWAEIEPAVRNFGRQGIAAMAISAVDIALWDLRARLLGQSLADSLGRFRDASPAYGSGGFTSYDDDRLASQLEGWVGEGFDRVKIKVGRDPGADPRRLEVARRAIGTDVDLMVDANGAFDRRAAARWAERYREAGVTYLEEPVSSEDLEGLRWLRAAVPPGIAIAAGEYAWDLPELERLADCVDVLQADVTRCGGITDVRRADGICRGRQIPFSAHCAPQVSAHVCCAMETAVHLEYFHDHSRLERMLFDGALVPSGGRLHPDPAAPGLGIELKRADAERFRVDGGGGGW